MSADNVAKNVATERDKAIDERLGTSTPRLASLEDLMYKSYSAEGWGLEQFASLADEEQRAVASDLLLSAVEGVKVNVRELALAVLEVHELVGPNGRTMPGPETTVNDLLADKRLHRSITDALRAFGSALDCLAAVTIGVLGLSTSLQRASALGLLAMPKHRPSAPSGQVDARLAVEHCFRAHANRAPSGWLAWALEMRNAVIHRGHLTRTWLQVPVRGDRRFELRTETPIHLLVRMQPHLRGRPWQPDMLALTGASTDGDRLIWLPEPATATLHQLQTRTIDLIEQLSGVLEAALAGDRAGWSIPDEAWRLDREPKRDRIVEAQVFRGFDPAYPVPPVAQMHVHSRSAARLQLAERVRLRSEGSGIRRLRP